MRVPVDHESDVSRIEQLLQRIVRRQRIAEVVRRQSIHVVVAHSVTEEQRTSHGRHRATHRQRGQERERTWIDIATLGCVGKTAKSVPQEPSLVVAANDESVGGRKQRAAPRDVPEAIDDIADTKNAIDAKRRKPSERKLDEMVLGVNVSEHADASQLGFLGAHDPSRVSLRCDKIGRSKWPRQ